MSHPDPEELEGALRHVADRARVYLDTLGERPARSPRSAEAARSFRGPLPERGSGALAALQRLTDEGVDAALATTGPRCFHWVVGGNTPAGLGADWWTSVLDQSAYAFVSSPLGVELERVALGWLAELFELPEHRVGILTTGASMANFVGFAAARQWWGERHGADVSDIGLSDLPRMPVLTSGCIHASAVKALGMLGIGRASVRRFASDEFGTLDLDALRRALDELDGAPALIVANAGEVNAGHFDPIDAMADLAAEYGAWLHVDGAFGLFARVSPRTRALAAGIERADSIASDGHKWLNVPYDCGFAWVKDPGALARSFVYDAAYLPDPLEDEPVLGSIGPESSRRARALSVWATLEAYGREGVRGWVEHHLDLAQRLARHVDASPDFERLAEVPLSIVCFRFRPQGVPESELDELNRKLGEAIMEDGRFYAGSTRYGGKTALRPAIVNWRTGPQDIDAFVDVLRELAARVLAAQGSQ